MKYQLLYLALCLAGIVTAVDVKYSELVAGNAVSNFGIKIQYKTSAQTEFIDYSQDSDTGEYPELNWDDDAKLKITITPPAEINTVSSIDKGKLQLGDPVQLKIEACFETSFTKNRKWRKPKNVIQDDKRCAKDLIKKTDLPTGEEAYEYTIKSDSPSATFFLTLFVYCEKPGEAGNELCGLDTTGAIQDLAKFKDVKKEPAFEDSENEDEADFYSKFDSSKSDMIVFRTATIDSRPTKLVVSVVVLSIISVSMLVLYFVYERVLKKTA